MITFIKITLAVCLILRIHACCDEPAKKLLTLEEAIAITLKNQRDIQISQMDIAEQRGIVQESAGPFDPLLGSNITHIMSQDRQNFPSGLITDRAAHQTLAGARLTKETRIGTKFSFIAEVNQYIDPLGYIVGNIPNPKANQGILAFEIEQPLLRGFVDGSNVTIERANKMQLIANILDNLHVVSTKITETVQQFWEVVAAQNLLKIREDTENRFITLTEKTQKLIKEEEIAKSDVLQPEAQLGRARVEKILSQQNLYSSMQTLLLNLGIAEEGFEVIGEKFVSSEFPPIPENLPVNFEIAEKYIDYALYARNDIRASKVREMAADILVKGGYNNLLPQLNVVAGVGKENFTIKNEINPIYRPLNHKHPQTNYRIGLRFSYPIGNDTARGFLYEQKAIKQRINLVTQQLGQGSYKDILDAWSRHIALSHAIKENAYVLEKNKQLVDNEQKKLSEGFSTLFVLIDFENRLTESLIVGVDLKKQFMQNIATLRYLTATVINPDSCLNYYYIDDVSTIPEINRSQTRAEK